MNEDFHLQSKSYLREILILSLNIDESSVYQRVATFLFPTSL